MVCSVLTRVEGAAGTCRWWSPHAEAAAPAGQAGWPDGHYTGIECPLSWNQPALARRVPTAATADRNRAAPTPPLSAARKVDPTPATLCCAFRLPCGESAGTRVNRKCVADRKSRLTCPATRCVARRRDGSQVAAHLLCDLLRRAKTRRIASRGSLALRLAASREDATDRKSRLTCPATCCVARRRDGSQVAAHLPCDLLRRAKTRRIASRVALTCWFAASVWAFESRPERACHQTSGARRSTRTSPAIVLRWTANLISSATCSSA